MPVKTTSRSGVHYWLLALDAHGHERTDDPDGPISRRLIEILEKGSVTDVFILSHGWQADVSAAHQQYDRWIEAMVRCTKDIELMQQVRYKYRPLIIGIHWPSLPWGGEEFETATCSFASPAHDPAQDLIDQYAAKLAETSAARAALKTIISAAIEDIAPENLSAEVREAYLALDREASLRSDGEGADPGADREPFDPDAIYRGAQQSVSFGGADLGGLIAPLRALSFWKMKDRALTFGESAGHRLLFEMQVHCTETVRFHLMGHSFGCIVMSAMLAGPPGGVGVPRSVHSLALVQGALSHWSYCTDIPVAKGRPGYFRPIIEQHRISGAIVTTSSARDTAVGRFYPLGAGARGDVMFAPGTLPKYGAMGAFGARGPGLNVEDMEMGPADCHYQFRPGIVYNLESTRYIARGGGCSGAHNDIAHAEVAHAVWASARGAS